MQVRLPPSGTKAGNQRLAGEVCKEEAMTSIFLGVAAVAVAAVSMPTTDPRSICESARSAALKADQATAYQSCLHDEQAARDQLRQRWSQFYKAAHSDCAEPQAVSISYVEVLTCLEMQNGGRFGAKAEQPSVPAITPTAPSDPKP
jgi:hypothetical protein